MSDTTDQGSPRTGADADRADATVRDETDVREDERITLTVDPARVHVSEDATGETVTAEER